MSRTSWRVLRTELLRGAAPVAGLAAALVGAWLLFIMPEHWAGRWGPLAELVRVSTLALVPIAVTTGAWQAGRERRWRMREQVAAAARPTWAAITTVWAAVTVGMIAGVLLVWLAGAVLVARVATYWGGGWWWTLAVGFAAVAAAAALGVLLGRVFPARLVAPVAGLATFVVMQAALGMRTTSNLYWLQPHLENPTFGGAANLPTGFHVTQGLWFAALAATCLVLVGAQRRWLAVVPGVVTAAVAISIGSGPWDERWQPDVAAQELVCAPGAGPEVCLSRINAFLLDDAAPVIRAHLERGDDVPAARVGVVDAAARDLPDQYFRETSNGFLEVWRFITWTGEFTATTRHGESLAEWIERSIAYSVDPDGERCAYEAVDVALEWAGGSPHYGEANEDGTRVDAGSNPRTERLVALSPAKQRDWMLRYLEAAPTCDGEAMEALLEELS